jgi:hypothetical protein
MPSRGRKEGLAAFSLRSLDTSESRSTNSRGGRKSCVAGTGFLSILRVNTASLRGESMPIASRLFFQAVRWAARRGLRDGVDPSPVVRKLESRRTVRPRRNLRLLVPPSPRLRSGSPKLRSPRFSGENRQGLLPRQSACLRRIAHGRQARRNVGFARTQRHARETASPGSHSASLRC